MTAPNTPGPTSEGGAPSDEIVVARQVYPPRLPIIPLPKRPMFPKTVSPFVLDQPELVKLVQQAVQSDDRLVGLVLKRQPDDDEPAAGEHITVVAPELHRVGVVGQILKAEQSKETGQPHVVIGALDRFEVRRILEHEPYLTAEVRYLYEPKLELTEELKAYAIAVINSIKDLLEVNPLFKEELNLLVRQGSFEDPGRLADYAAFLTSAKGERLQEVLEILDVRARLQMVLELLREELDLSKLQAKLRQQIEERVSKQQREFFLREQLKAIKKELGLEKDDKEAEIQRFLERLESRVLTDEAKQRIDEEVEKLRLLEPSSPEFNLTRNYLDWLTVLPWGVRSQNEVGLERAREVLEAGHYGLEDVKARILELIAAGILKGSFSGSILCLVGPPGVGKTSIGKSIAAALGREFYRFSLGGMRDEAEITGHRRTYIGAMPGKFLQAMRVCGTADPVIMLDEIDKIGTGFRGDPAAALLEALDPEQNREFLDHYLDVRFDLSNVLFVCTANQLDTIPGPLLDRMEVIKLSGYLLEEKLEIARRFIVPRETKAHGLKRSQLVIQKSALREIADGYSREAGLRGLEKNIRKVVRKSAVELLEGQSRGKKKISKVTVRPADVADLLGKRIFTDDSPYDVPLPGVIRGLAWTSLGGDTLYVEARRVEANRAGFKQTGQLGKVMVESSEIAYTYVRSLVDDDESCRKFFNESFIHLHVPAGATPKDGPSAGITMALALYTLCRGKPVRRGFAMTGELTLSGFVMPVGGIKEKVIAAKRAKVKHVVLPKDNERDWAELPDHVKRGIEPHFVGTFEEVVSLCV